MPDLSASLDRFKEFWPTSFATRHPTSVFVLFALVTVGGILSYRSLPKEAQPEIEIPTISVNTVYPGVSPSDMESLVTRPLEDELNTISDVEELRSTSVEGYSAITVEFATSVDMNEALQKVREKVDLARPELPDDAEEPTINEFNLSDVPVMQVNLSGDYGLVRLKEVGEELQDRIEAIPSVLRAELRGGLEREVQVQADLSRLKFYGVALGDVVEAIQSENVNVPGGSIDVGSRKYLLRVDGEFPDPAVIEDLVVTTVRDRPIYVRDLADVEFGFADRETFARLDGQPVVTLDVIKRSGENIIETAESVRETIDGMESLFPAGTVVKITSDQSDQIHQMVTSLENNIISGLLLIVAVLMFFLGARNSVFVAISIPTSMLLSFLVLQMAGVTMNMVVLFSLILALGMLVDNAIVVVENIYRYMEEGWERTLAARKATGEVALPVIGATLTTLAAFLPLMFWPGMVGEFMKFLPLTLIITLSSSLFVALVIVPTLCAAFMSVEGRERPSMPTSGRWILAGTAGLLLVAAAVARPLTALLLLATAVLLVLLHHFVLAGLARRFQQRWMPAMVDWYEGVIRGALRHRGAVVAGSGAVLVLTVVAFGALNHGVEFFPEDIPPSQAWVDVETPVGSRPEFTDGKTREVEADLPSVEGMEDAESVVTVVGGSGGGGNFMTGGPSGPDEGRITVSFVDYEDRRHDVFEVISRMESRLGRDLAGAEVSVQRPQEGPPSGPPVNVEIAGEDPEVLRELADRARAIVQETPAAEKLTGLESDMDEGRPEMSIRVDRERASLYGLSSREVGMAVRGAVQGIEAAEYRTGSDEYDIVVRLAERWRKDVDVLEELVAVTDLGHQVPLLSVARWDVSEGYGSIRRKDMDRVATLSSDVRAGYNSNAVLAEVQTALADFRSELPPGYQMRYTGQSEEQRDAQGFLTTAFLIALMLMGFILISQFDSVTKPLIILSSVAMSTVGVLAGLLVFRMPFVVIMTGVGVISLAGIVVNNAIVLIDYIDILRNRDGLGLREALIQGGMTRFRPVVLTALTTALGLVPLAIGLNFDFFGLYGSLSPDLYWGGEQAAWWGPMAVAVIVGIVFATFLTLVLVPVMYSLVEEAADTARKHFVAAEEPAMAGAPAAATTTGTPGTAPAGAAATASGAAPAERAPGSTREPDREDGGRRDGSEGGPEEHGRRSALIYADPTEDS